MNCKKCGSIISETERFCATCGAPVENLINANPFNGQPNSVGINQIPNVIEPVVPQPLERPIDMPVQSHGQVVGQQPVVPTMPPMGMYQGPIPTQQPMMSGIPQNIATGQNTAKKSNLIYIIIGIVAFTAVIVVSLIFLLGKDGKKDSDNSSSNSNSNDEVVVETKKSTYKVSYNGLIFKIPTNLIYTKAEDRLSVYDENETWLIQIYINEGNIKTMTAEQFGQWLGSNGAKIENTLTKTYGSKQYLLANYEYNGNKVSSGAIQLNSMYYAIFEGINTSSTYFTSEYEQFSSIFEGIEVDDSSFNADTNNFIIPKEPFHKV